MDASLPTALQSSNASSAKSAGASLNVSVCIKSGPGDFLGFNMDMVALIRVCKESGTSNGCMWARGVMLSGGFKDAIADRVRLAVTGL